MTAIKITPWECKTGIAYYSRQDRGNGIQESTCQSMGKYGYVYYSGSQHCFTYDTKPFGPAWDTDDNGDWKTCRKRSPEELAKLDAYLSQSKSHTLGSSTMT
eukprot:UN01956